VAVVVQREEHDTIRGADQRLTVGAPTVPGIVSNIISHTIPLLCHKEDLGSEITEESSSGRIRLGSILADFEVGSDLPIR
jgi:hypothetical protein